MRLEKIAAWPHPDGNRIDLTWVNPHPDEYPLVCVVRRERTHPTSAKDGVVVPQFSLDLSFQVELDDEQPQPSSDLQEQFCKHQAPLTENAIITVNVAGGRWLIKDGEQEYIISREENKLDVHNERLSFAMDQDLKGETVYYYTLFPYTSLDENGNLTDYVFEPHNRAAALATAPYDMAGRMYQLLPGIYHRYDDEDRPKGPLRHFLDLPGGQLDQLHSMARAMLDLHNTEEVDGRLLPLLAQWIGWQLDYRQEMAKQRNEVRGAPYVQATIGIIPTVEATVKRVLGWESRTKEFLHNVFLSNRPERLNLWARERQASGEWSEPTEPLSLDFAYEGRPTAVRDGDDTLWLFYQARRGHWDAQGKRWRDQWDIWYKTLSTFSVWAPSQPLTNRRHLDKHPTAVVRGETVWIFWDSYDEANHAWRIDYRIRQADGEWSPTATFADPDANAEPERRRPWAVVDHEGGLWLFWLEKVEARWQLQYNRHDGPDWDEESLRLSPSSAKSFPLDDHGKSVQSDIFAFADPDSRLWLFWARKVKAPNDESDPTEATAGKPNPTRWQIAYRFTAGIDDWSPIYTLPQGPADYDCREPAVIWNETEGTIELFWSSNRDGSWSIWHGPLDATTHECGTAERITGNPYSQRDPLPVSLPASTLLVYRSNESLTYVSKVYGATETLDARYAGCTTVDTRNLSKIALRGQYADFQTYTYDSGQNGKRTDQNWYAGDTVGIYFTPDTDDLAQIAQDRGLIEDILRQFLPTQVRAAFILDAAVYKEWVDTCIGEQFWDRITTTEG